MSFSRVFYDSNDYNVKKASYNNYVNYRIFPDFAESTAKCIPVLGPTSESSSHDSGRALIDLETIVEVGSQLTRRSNPITRNDFGIGNVSKLNYKIPFCKLDSLTGEDTRFSHPIDDYRCISATNYYMQPYLPVNPQDTITQLVIPGNSSRIRAKEEFKMKPHQSWEDKNVFPTGGPDNIFDVNSRVGFCDKNTENQVRKLLCR
jgi:hypothetical protein